MALAQLIGELETLAETIPKHTDSVQQLVDVVPRLIAAAEAFEKILAGAKNDVEAIVTLDPTKTTPAAAAVTLPVAEATTGTAAPGPIAIATLPVAEAATGTAAPGPITIETPTTVVTTPVAATVGGSWVDPAGPASAPAPAEPTAGVVLAEPPAPTPTA